MPRKVPILVIDGLDDVMGSASGEPIQNSMNSDLILMGPSVPVGRDLLVDPFGVTLNSTDRKSVEFRVTQLL